MKKVLISGGNGLIGKRLANRLQRDGYQVGILTRTPDKQAPLAQFAWDPTRRLLDPKALDHMNILIHLAGESLASARWSVRRKEQIRSSRIDTALFLLEQCRLAGKVPDTLIGGSATGYYGPSKHGQVYTEVDSPGTGFLPEICVAWENASSGFAQLGSRVVNLRTGLVCSNEGGFMAPFLKSSRLGLVPVIGNGNNWLPWIHIDDLCSAILYTVQNSSISGPCNGVAPENVSQRGLALCIASHYHPKRWVVGIPAFLPKLVLGEMSQLLTLSQAIAPRVLLEQGFRFQFPDIDSAMADLLPQRPL